jgi:two-component system, NarL family, response regulator LiaR
VPAPANRPVRVAVSDDYELLLAGMAAVLEPYADRVKIVELTTEEGLTEEADVVLFDTFGVVSEKDQKLQTFLHDTSARVLVYSWDFFPADRAVEQGACGYVFKGASARELVEAIEAVHDGEKVIPPEDHPTGEHLAGDWPGKAAGLTSREAEVLALVTAGHTNDEIAADVYLSVNTVKTYLRQAYRKIGVSRRSQAVAWGIQNGMMPQ